MTDHIHILGLPDIILHSAWSGALWHSLCLQEYGEIRSLNVYFRRWHWCRRLSTPPVKNCKEVKGLATNQLNGSLTAASWWKDTRKSIAITSITSFKRHLMKSGNRTCGLWWKYSASENWPRAKNTVVLNKPNRNFHTTLSSKFLTSTDWTSSSLSPIPCQTWTIFAYTQRRIQVFEKNTNFLRESQNPDFLWATKTISQ